MAGAAVAAVEVAAVAAAVAAAAEAVAEAVVEAAVEAVVEAVAGAVAAPPAAPPVARLEVPRAAAPEVVLRTSPTPLPPPCPRPRRGPPAPSASSSDPPGQPRPPRAPPSYAGGRYAGGSGSSYAAGSRSPRGIAPVLLGAAALGFLPGLWLYGAYNYPYSNSYYYRNSTTNRDERLNVTCLCDPYSPCGCDDYPDNTTTQSGVRDVLNNGSAKIEQVNGTRTVVINGTLPNGTDNSSSSGGSSGATSVAAGGWKRTVLEASGWWSTLLIVCMTVWM